MVSGRFQRNCSPSGDFLVGGLPLALRHQGPGWVEQVRYSRWLFPATESCWEIESQGSDI